MAERKRIQIPLSFVCLIVALAAVGMSLFLSTYRHNAQLMEMTRLHNAQLMEQTERFNAQMKDMTDLHNAQMMKLTADSNKEITRLNGQAPAGDPASTARP